MLLLALAAGAFLLRRRVHLGRPVASSLTEVQRQAALRRVEAWLQAEEGVPAPAGAFIETAGGRA